ncbi:MAG TPA: lytic transglycosylase domain-containing protein [Polyangiaceae bacterium]|jgi:soluble lytic murein transglycosylase-like protein
MRLAPLVAVLFLSTVAAADIYQYTDKDGVVHIVNSVPHGVSARLLVHGGNAPRTGPPIVAPSDHDPARFRRYDEWIRQAATLYQIPEQLVRAVIKVESDYDPRAVSVSGARGLMQLMPDTAERMQVRDIDDPRENIFGGVRLLRILANAFNGDLSLTVAAYNAGPDAVMRYGGIPPFDQTRNYVVKVTSFYRRYRTTVDVVEASIGP